MLCFCSIWVGVTSERFVLKCYVIISLPHILYSCSLTSSCQYNRTHVCLLVLQHWGVRDQSGGVGSWLWSKNSPVITPNPHSHSYPLLVNMSVFQSCDNSIFHTFPTSVSTAHRDESDQLLCFGCRIKWPKSEDVTQMRIFWEVWTNQSWFLFISDLGHPHMWSLIRFISDLWLCDWEWPDRILQIH